VLASGKSRSRNASNGRQVTPLEVCDELSTGWVWGGACVTGALQSGHREEGLSNPIAHLVMTTATKKLYAVVESWSAPMAIPGFKGYWVKINIQRGDIKSAEQTALALMAEGQIARVRMLDLNTGRYEAFPV
jgi:hypothetical protein